MMYWVGLANRMPYSDPMQTPLQIVLHRDPSNAETRAFETMLRLAFEGSAGPVGSPSTYLADAVDLQIRVLDLAETPRGNALDGLLRGAGRTVAVVVYGDADNTFDASATLRDRVERDGGQVVLAKLPNSPVDDARQAPIDPDAMEPALLPVTTALRAMEAARRVLLELVGDGEGPPNNQLKLFLSHAKIDGVPVALSLASILARLREAGSEGGFGYFYDVEHIPAGDDWRKALEEAAKRSVLIALRTEEYERRPWCQKEYLWAESNRMPILVVDLRTATHHDSALLPFDAAPVVHVHDGNVIRVVFHALACHLRMLRVQCLAGAADAILPHKPTPYSLLSTCDALRQGNRRKVPRIAYPNPPLPAEFLDSVRPILEARQPAVALVTHDEIET